MGLFSKESLSEATIKDPSDIFKEVLQGISGANYSRNISYRIFYRIIGFKGCAPGVGCSTIVANTALALADLGLNVCVFDTSVLHPVQDTLLKTNADSVDEKDRVDWFDLPYSNGKSVLHVSSRNKHISVLSFYGKKRTVLDMFSSLDSPELVDIAVNTLKDKFDVILIDLCEELTKVNIFSMQKAQHVLQVWDDSVTALSSLNETITNVVTLSCPMDKMRYVIENKMHDDVMGDLDALYKQYRFRMLAHCPNSTEISRLCSMNQPLWQYATKDKDITQFTQMIVDIVKHICNIADEQEEKKEKEKKEKKKKVTTADVLAGNVEGTVHHKLKKQREEIESIVETPDLSVEQGNPEDEYAEEYIELEEGEEIPEGYEVIEEEVEYGSDDLFADSEETDLFEDTPPVQRPRQGVPNMKKNSHGFKR